MVPRQGNATNRSIPRTPDTLIKSQVPEPMIKGFVAVFVYYPYTTAQTSYKRSTALRSSSTSGCV